MANIYQIKKKHPRQRVLLGNVVSNPNLAPNVDTFNLNQIHTNLLMEDAPAPASPTPGAGVFLSLSKGTLNSTPAQIHTTQSPHELVQTMAKHYDDKVKLFQFKQPLKIRKPGFEIERKEKPKILPDQDRTQEQIDESIRRSVNRTRRELADIAEMNVFDHFATFTFDPSRHDAYDIAYTDRKMMNWLNNVQKKHGAFNYLMVSERMKDGKVHYHALLGGFTGKYHATGKYSTHLGKKCARFKIDSWEKSNGFADMEEMGDKKRTAAYLVKYISKEYMIPSLLVKNRKRYWASKSLKRPTQSYHDTIDSLAAENQLDLASATEFENDFCKITTIPRKVL